MPALNITDADFETTILAADKPALVDCWAVWCGPCKKLSPIVDEIADEFSGRAVVSKLDVGTHTQVAAKYGVQSLPTILLFKGGELVDRLHGRLDRTTLRTRLEELA